MKRFLLLALTAGLLSPIAAEAFWKYGSKYEAKKACEAWRAKSPTYSVNWKETLRWYEFEGGEPRGYMGGRYIWKDGELLIGELKKEVKNRSRKVGLRECWPEKDTKQFLGMQMQGPKAGAIYTRSEEREKEKGMKLVKRFNY